MNYRIKTKWLNALRSELYKNNKSKALVTQNGNTYTYNALGVLCSVTGNLHNRDLNKQFPKVAREGYLEEFVGLSPTVQQNIVELSNNSDNYKEVIRYISRNIKVST